MARLLGGILGVRIMGAVAIGMLNAAAALLAVWSLYIGLVGLSPVLMLPVVTAVLTRVSGRPGVRTPAGHAIAEGEARQDTP